MANPNVRFIIDNYADDATLSASAGVVAAMPVTNLQDPSRGRFMRTTSIASQTINGNFTLAALVSSVVLYSHTLTSSATWQIKFYDGLNQTGTLLFDSGAQPAYSGKSFGELIYGVDVWGASVFTGWGKAFSQLWMNSGVVALSFQIIIQDPSNTVGYWDAGRLIIGNYLEPLENIDYGAIEFGWQEDSKQTRTGGGTLRTDVAAAGSFRQLSFSLDYLNEGERAKFAEFQRKGGLRKDFFVSVFATQGGALERDHAMLGKITTLSAMGRPSYIQAGSIKLNIEEA
jgi:hypothetical protein